MSRFDHLKKQKKDVVADPVQSFIDGAIERVEGTPAHVDTAQAGGGKKEKFLLSLDAADNALIVKLSNMPDDFKCSKAAVVVAAVRAFDNLSDQDKLDYLRLAAGKKI